MDTKNVADTRARVVDLAPHRAERARQPELQPLSLLELEQLRHAVAGRPIRQCRSTSNALDSAAADLQAVGT